MLRFCFISKRSDFLEGFKIVINFYFPEEGLISLKVALAMFPILALRLL